MDFDQTWYILSRKRIWNPSDFKGHRSKAKFLGEGIRYALHCPCFSYIPYEIWLTDNKSCKYKVRTKTHICAKRKGKGGYRDRVMLFMPLSAIFQLYRRCHYNAITTTMVAYKHMAQQRLEEI